MRERRKKPVTLPVTLPTRHAEKQARYRDRQKGRIAALEHEIAELKALVVNGHRKKPKQLGLDLDLAIEASDAFERFWSVYPKRDGSNPKKPAAVKFQRLVAKGINPDDIIQGAERYARVMVDKEPKFVAMAITWLNQERWKDQDWIAPPEPSFMEMAEQFQREAEDNYEREHGRRATSDAELSGHPGIAGAANYRRH